MIKPLKCIGLYLILLLASMVRDVVPAQAFTTKTDDTHPFGLTFDSDAAVYSVGGVVRLEFLFTIPKNHYLYGKSIQVELADKTLKYEVIKPDGEIKYDDFMGEELEVFHGSLPVEVKLIFDGKSPQSVVGKIYYQGCSAKICYRLFSQDFEFKLLDGQGPQAKDAPGANQSIRALLALRDFGAVLKQGWLLAAFVTFFAGVITGFTPCVLPVIPLTLTFIGASKNEDKATRLKHLLVFVCGLVVMYATLGVASAALGKTLGFAFQSRIFVGFVVVVFTLMGLWSLGLVHWQTPLRLQQIIVRYQPQGYARDFYSGLTIGFLAAPCVGPILGPLLLYIATTKRLVLGFGYMTAYALGLSVLFFILGFVSRSSWSRWGQVGHWFKKSLGVLMLVTAVYYAYVLVAPQLATKDGFFIKDFDVALQKARDDNKSLLVDFYADWCVPCHEWDQKTWSDAHVQEVVLKAYVPVKIDCTLETPQCKDLIDTYQVSGWPTILFLRADGSEIAATRLVGVVMGPDEFLDYLSKVNFEGTHVH